MISAALLAGGASRRMGRDKCLIELDGNPLWSRQLVTLRACAAEVAVVSPDRPAWCPQETPWWSDGVRRGPLGALEAALHAASHDRVILLAVDLPAMTPAYLRELTAHSSATSGVVPIQGDLFQPLAAVYPRSALPVVRHHLSGIDHSMQRLLRALVAAGRMTAVPVLKADLPLFRNLNSPQD